MATVCVFGDRAWWLWIVVPLYSVWLAYSTFMGVKSGFGGMGGGDGSDQAAPAGGESKRQKKLEKRGGQRTQYR